MILNIMKNSCSLHILRTFCIMLPNKFIMYLCHRAICNYQTMLFQQSVSSECWDNVACW